MSRHLPRLAPAALIVAASLALGPAAARKASLTPEQQLAKLTGGAQPGQPRSCIPQFPTLNSATITNYGIVYYRGRDAWLNRLGGSCHVSDNDTIITNTPQNQFCRGDIVQVIDRLSRFPRDSCTFDDFIPYRRPDGKSVR